MQTVSAAFTAEARDKTRSIAHNLAVSWKKQLTTDGNTFTIGVSSIGGVDVVGATPGNIGSPSIYKYFDETSYVTSLSWERQLALPHGGLTKAFAEGELDNTSGRFLPDYMGGRSELFTSVVPRRPFMINAGFKIDGFPTVIPQFAGIFNRSPVVSNRNKTVRFSGADYVDFFEGKYMDHVEMFTSERSDTVIETILRDELGLSTSQYVLDEGLNNIGFGVFDSGSKFSDIINEIVRAENANFYQDEFGIFRFENRQHWDRDTAAIDRLILTGQVIEAQSPSEDQIINVVEIKGVPRDVEDFQLIWKSAGYAGTGVVLVPANSTAEVWANYNDPVFVVTSPVPNGSTGQTSFWVANSAADGSGTDKTANLSLRKIENFAQSSKMVFENNTVNDIYIVSMEVWGKPARRTGDIYFRDSIGSSLTAYEERRYSLESPYIQDISWARSLATNILNDFAEPQNMQNLTIRAMPSLEMGDLVSWQGTDYRIYGIKARLSPSQGFIQDLKLLKHITKTFFRIGISVIEGPDRIAA